MKATALTVEVADEKFDPSERLGTFIRQQQAGAVASFCGSVRGCDGKRIVRQLRIDHYPGMTEKCMLRIAQQAQQRWQLAGALAIHRCGLLEAGEPIVLVAAAADHRKAAFAGCQMMIDYLKTDAPFWKQEIGPEAKVWVAAKQEDDSAKLNWES